MMLKRCKGFKNFYLLLWDSIKFAHNKIQIGFLYLRLQHLEILRSVWNTLMNSSIFKISFWWFFPSLSLRIHAVRNNIPCNLILIYFFNDWLIFWFFHSFKRIRVGNRSEWMFFDQNLKIFIMSSFLLFSFLFRG